MKSAVTVSLSSAPTLPSQNTMARDGERGNESLPDETARTCDQDDHAKLTCGNQCGDRQFTRCLVDGCLSASCSGEYPCIRTK
jgi:hypothetical protein